MMCEPDTANAEDLAAPQCAAYNDFGKHNTGSKASLTIWQKGICLVGQPHP